jgi:hypothetical protein
LGLAEFGAGATYDFNGRLEARLAGYADGAGGDGINGDIPETGARRSDASREILESTAMVGVTATIFEAAKVCIAHQANIAGLGALDDDNIVFVKVLALVNKFHGCSKKVESAEKSAR